MSWLVVLFAIEAGLMPSNDWYLYQEHELFEQDQPGYYNALEVDAELWGWAFVGGTLRTDMTSDSFTNYNPHWVTYNFTAGARWKAFEIGWRHRCSHPIQTYVYNSGDYKDPIVEGSYDEIYARAQFRVGGE
jgi:hypothetical protein